MKLLFDENLPPRLADVLQSEFSGSMHVHSCGLGSADDQAIWEYAGRESEIALGKFKVGWPGKGIKFEELCEDFERSHFAGISEGTIKGYRAYLKHLKAFFEGFVLTNITTSWSKNIATIAGSNPPFAIKAAPSKVRP